jgi:glycosyltransferase involved in cell wall biosynthesis
MTTVASMPISSMTPSTAEGPATTALPRAVVVATHYYASGPAFDLEDYLSERTSRLLFIAHPLYAGGGPSYARCHEGGRLVRTTEEPGWQRLLRFGADVGRTVAWVRRSGHYDLFIAGDNLLALAGLWLRRRGTVRRVILYSIDYVPRRFSNSLLNGLYHRVDRFAARRADVVWNLSPAIEAARLARDGPGRSAPSIIVPVGNHYSRIGRTLQPSAPHRIAFLGHLLEKQGVQLVIEALPLIRAAVPDISLLVLGDGPFLPALRQLAGRLGVESLVEFAGFVADHREIEQRLAESAVGLAPYVPEAASFTRFADPGKIKTYLACGLPVILTDVPPAAIQIEQRGAGRIVRYEVSELADAVIAYLADPPRLAEARKAAASLGAESDWLRIFGNAFHASETFLR